MSVNSGTVPDAFPSAAKAAPPVSRRLDKFCIIGAGSSGLAAAKNFQEAGIPFDCLEREDDVGGNWYFGKPGSSVFASTHLISSKRLTEYVDFPMPEEWPEYPHQRQAWAYLREYARHFDLYKCIEFNTAVEWIERVGDFGAGGDASAPGVAPPLTPPRRAEGNGETFAKNGETGRDGWVVRLASGEVRHYGGLVIANGHNWDPRWPEYPGEFTGETLHSSEYKTPDVMRGKRVLVVGGGNSGCDLAVEAALHADQALLSVRRAYPILPKFFRGRPIDQCGEFMLWMRAPLWLRRLSGRLVSHFVLGPTERTGVPRPDHKLWESHPIINSQLHYQTAHGKLAWRPDIERLDGSWVHFVDGSKAEVDLIIYATGFKISFPFIDMKHLNWRDGAPRLFLNVFHPERDDVFCIGLIQPDSGQWGLADWQSRLAACYVKTLREDPGRAAWFRRLKREEKWDLNGGTRYLDSPRHALEVEHYSYRRKLRKLWGKLG